MTDIHSSWECLSNIIKIYIADKKKLIYFWNHWLIAHEIRMKDNKWVYWQKQISEFLWWQEQINERMWKVTVEWLTVKKKKISYVMTKHQMVQSSVCHWRNSSW